MSYTNIFGGSQINVAFPSYAAYNITANQQLNWATSFTNTVNSTAAIMDYTASVGGLTVTLADATLISPGQSFTINNVGAQTIAFNNFLGGNLFNITPTQVFSVYLTDNTTQGGTWQITQNGAGTAQAQASLLAAPNGGTININGQIAVNMPNVIINANYPATINDRGKLYVWSGGAGTITLPTLATVGNGFYMAFNNQGGGTLTINPNGDGSTIDGNGSLQLKPGQSVIIDGGSAANWNTLGLGQPSTFVVSAITVNVAGNVNYTLSTQQAASQIIKFEGALTGNINVVFPTVVSIWYLYNFTSGLFTLSAQLTGGPTINIPQGEQIILYCDGTNLFNTPTVATSVVFSDANAANPSIAFATDRTSGFYKVGNGSMGYSSLGTNALTLGAISGGQTGLGIASGDVLQLVGTNAGHYASLIAGNMAAAVTWTLPVADATNAGGILQSNAAGALSFSTAAYPAATTIDQILYSSANNTITGLATANNGTLITSAGGVPSISSTLPTAVQGNITTLGTIATGVWNGTGITVPFGGTGLATFTTAYGVVCAGTTATGALQNAGVGAANQVFTSGGGGVLPSWQSINVSLPAANKPQQIAAASTAVYTSPFFQQFHPSSAKFWCYFNGNTAGTNAPLAGYNVASVTRLGAGQYQINFTTPFTTANYVVIATCGTVGASSATIYNNALATNNCQINAVTISNAPILGDPAIVMATGYGTQ